MFENQLSRNRDFASPSDPFNLAPLTVEAGVGPSSHDMSYKSLGKPEYSEELLLVATLAYWFSSFVYPIGEGNELRAETFPIACQMARGVQTTVGVSCLSSLYTHLDYLTDKRRSPQGKKGGFQVHYMLGWLATYCLSVYNEQSEVGSHLLLLCKIAKRAPRRFLSKRLMNFS